MRDFFIRKMEKAKACLAAMPSRFNRWLHGGIAAFMAAGLICCVFLKPDPNGMGTHRQLGLPACLICRAIGVDHCPSCGLTTAFSHIVRGHFKEAQRCNPAAVAVFAFWLACMGYCFTIAATGRQWVGYEFIAVICLTAFTAIWWIVSLYVYM